MRHFCEAALLPGQGLGWDEHWGIQPAALLPLLTAPALELFEKEDVSNEL